MSHQSITTECLPSTIFLAAIEHDDVDLLRSTPAWIALVTNSGDSIFYAVRQHRAKKCLIAILTECRELDPTVDNKINDRLTFNCINEAIEHRDVEFTKIYLDNAKVSLERFNRLLINGSVNDEHVDILRLFINYLISNDLNANCASNQWDGETTLKVAAQLNYPRLTQLLVNAAPHVNIYAVDAIGNTALHYAAKFGHTKCVQILHDGQARATVIKKEGQAPRQVAGSETVESLSSDSCLQKNVNPDKNVDNPDAYIKTLEFQATIETALTKNSVDILTKQDNWADQMTRLLTDDFRGNDILCYCTLRGRQEILEAIFTHCGSFPVNAEHYNDGSVFTPLQYAIRYGTVAAVQFLINHAKTRSIDLTRRSTYARPDDSIWTCGLIMTAVECGKLNVLGALINHPDIDVNEVGEWREYQSTTHKLTPLILAVVGTRKITNLRGELVRILLTDNRIDVNIRDDQGHTALMYAVMFNDVELVGLLLTENTDLSAKAPNGKTAAQFATPKIKKMIRNFASARRRRVEEKTKENANPSVVRKTTVKMQTTESSSNTAIQSLSENNRTKALSDMPEPSTTSAPTAATTVSTVTTDESKKSSASGSISARIQHGGRVCQQCQSTTVVDTVLQPCNHLALCQNCVDDMRKNKRFSCPMCKQRVMKYVRICL